MHKKIIAFIFVLLPILSHADMIVDFNNPSSFKSISIYDSWEDSPFTKGELEGNWAIEEGVLAAQRSRYGSNLFGARIDLAQEFELHPEVQYVRLKLFRPTDGRVALIGLGSRKERLSQNPYTEQFYQESLDSVPAGEWADVIFPINGAEGVVIRSLVVLPDCESPHNLPEDFLFYISDIELLPSLP